MKILIAKNKVSGKLFDMYLKVSWLFYFSMILGNATGRGLDKILSNIALMIIVLNTIIIFIFGIKKVRLLTQNTIFYFLFFALGMLSQFWALNPKDVLNVNINMIQIIIVSIALNCYITNKNSLIIILKIVAISSVYMSLKVLVTTPVSYYGTGEFGISTGNHFNTIGHILAVCSVICAYLGIILKNKKYFVFLLINLSVTLLTGSRKSFLMIIFAIIIFTLFQFNIVKTFKYMFISLFLCGGLFILIMSNDTLYELLGSRIGSIFNRSITDVSVNEREYFIEQAKGLFLQKPILGWGLDNFRSYMRQIGYKHVTYCHNNYLEVLCNLGIIGFIIYYYRYYKILIMNFSIFKLNKKNNKMLNLLLFTTIMLFIVFEYGFVSYFGKFYQIIISITFLGAQCISKENN